VWPEIIRNGLGLDLANSFLIVGAHSPSALPEPQVLAWHYSADRAPQYCREACFSGEAVNGVTVSYQRLCQASKSDYVDSDLVRFDCPQNVRYTRGRVLSQEFIDLMGRDGWSTEAAGGFVRRYAAVLETLCRGEGDNRAITSITDRLPGKYLDVIPQNIILEDVDTPVIIDNEWRLTTDVEFGHCVLRALLLLMATITRFGVPANSQTYTRQAFVEAVFTHSGFAISATEITRYIDLEADIQAQITGRLRDEFLDWSPADFLMMQSTQSLVSEQLSELNRLQAIAEAQRTEVQMIYTSTSWKITAPLRRLSRALRGGKSTTEFPD
jgi:hypothetical protein